MSSEATPLVGIIMGSKSDMPAMEACTEQLDAFGVPYELVIASAHRAPAKVHEWATTAADRGIRVVSGLDMIKPSEANREYGIFRFNEDGSIYNLAAPVWDWGRYYELIIKTILNESWPDKTASKERALNYWWGMSAGVIDVILSKDLPFYSRKMVDAMRNALVAGTLNPFAGELHSQTGIVQEADSMVRLSNEEIASMNWLNDNVVGSLPVKAALSESGKKAVQTSGVIKE